MDPLILKKLNKSRANRKACIVVTNIEDGRDRLVVEGDPVEGELGQAVAKVFLSGKSRSIELAGVEFFLNVHLPPPRIIVIGAVHISQALVAIASISGFEVEVIDPRTAFATPQRFEGVRLYADWPQEVLKSHPLDAYCALVAVTHDPKIDDFPIVEALQAECFYIGALGSQKTHSSRLQRLREQGVSQSRLASIHGPIGLDIGASTPQEIAVAIMAQIIEAFRKRDIGSIEKVV